VAKTKGSNLVDMVKFLRSSREAALPLLPMRLHRYLDERVQISQWYPEEDMIDLVRVLAKLLPSGGGDVFERIGTLNARNHLEGVYEHLLTDLDLASLPSRLIALWGTMHDTGSCHMNVEGPGQALVELVEYGYPTREMCAIVGAYVREAFRLAGLRAPRVSKLDCRLNGSERCSWQVRWEEAAAA
jgi:hypothetical protein